jgi:hypothetical protein
VSSYESAAQPIKVGYLMHRGWVGAGYSVARQLDPDGVTAHLVARFGQD